MCDGRFISVLRDEGGGDKKDGGMILRFKRGGLCYGARQDDALGFAVTSALVWPVSCTAAAAISVFTAGRTTPDTKDGITKRRKKEVDKKRHACVRFREQ